MYAFFSSTLKGLPTIRAYSAQSRFHEEFLDGLSVNGSWCEERGIEPLLRASQAEPTRACSRPFSSVHHVHPRGHFREALHHLRKK